jgi:hypothetical protein
MASCPRSSKRLAIATLALFSLVLTACDSDRHQPLNPVGFGGTSFVTSILPEQLGITPISGFGGFGCPLFPSFTTRFNLVVNPFAGDIFLQEATFRLVDGSSVGGSPLLVSATDIAARFGTTLIPAGTRRTFGFTPQFSCVAFQPRSLLASLVLLDRAGSRHLRTMTVPIF